MKLAQIDLDCYAVQYSPFSSSKIACAASQNFGLNGSGSLYIFENQRNKLILEKRFDYNNGLYDLGWSEFDPHIITTVSNDGYIQIWNEQQTLKHPLVCSAPWIPPVFYPQLGRLSHAMIFVGPVLHFHFIKGLVSSFRGHESEINSVVWNLTRDKPLFATGSWDHTIKLWDPCRESPLLTLSDHNSIVYEVSWSPHLPAVILSCAGDGNARTWDLREGSSTNVIPSCSGEVLSCDWTKYDSMIFATSGTDSTLKMWDLRRFLSPLQILIGHEYPARRIKLSPHNQGVLASVSYDKTTRTWDYLARSTPTSNMKHHSEFVTGIDFNLENEGEVVDCSWDKTIRVFRAV